MSCATPVLGDERARAAFAALDGIAEREHLGHVLGMLSASSA